MNDFSAYNNSELYSLLDHLSYYEHPEKVEAVEQEIERRKEEGKIPEQMIPPINWSDLKFWKRSGKKKKEVKEGSA